MNNRIELILSGGSLDLYGDEPINLNFSIADIKDITKRNSTFSYDFRLPGTKNNSLLFNSIFEITADCLYNPNKKVPASILVDTIPVAEGYFQLTNIFVDDQKGVEYEGVVYGENDNIIKQIGDLYLTDLDWSELNHYWTYSAITNSWNTSGDTFFYPLIDYGYDWELAEINGVNNSGAGVLVNQMFPATYARYILKKIFSAAGYTWTSSFLDGDQFKRLIIPYNGNQDFNQPVSFANNRSFRAQQTVDSGFTTGNIYSSAYDSGFNKINFIDDFNYPNFDNGNLYISGSSSYSSDTFSYQSFRISIDTQITSFTGGPGYSQFNIYVKDNSGSTIWQGNEILNLPIGYRGQIIFNTPYLYLQPGQIVQDVIFNFHQQLTVANAVHPTGVTAITIYSANTYWDNNISSRALPGQLLDYNQFIPSQIKQVDFLTSLVSMFNLWIEPDKNNSKNLIIEPRDTYLSAGTVKNWTKKVDISQKISEQLTSELQTKEFVLQYKPDNDFFNEDYLTTTKSPYGWFLYQFDNDFTSDRTTREVIFSPTPLTNVVNSSTIIVPKIGKVDSNNNFGKTNFNIRILQRDPGGVVNTIIGDSWALTGNTLSYYPYAGHLSSPFTGETDINFGTIEFSFYALSAITNQNLGNVYWKKYLDEIADKDSKIITTYVNLNPQDVYDLRFNDSIFIENLTPEGGAYYLINNLEYSPTKLGPQKVELLKLKEKTTPVITAHTRSLATFYNRPPLSTLNLGANQVLSPGSVVVGIGNTLDASASASIVIGRNNTVGYGAQNARVFGNNNTVAPGVTGATIFGDGVSATTNNTVYETNVVILSSLTLSSGATLNLSGTSLGLWTSSTGSNSIIASNTQNLGSSSYSFVANGYQNSAITNSYATVINGRQNTASGQFSFIGNGTSLQVASGQISFIGNGYNNSAGTGYYATILNGVTNKASGQFSSIVNGSGNLSTGSYSSILNGRLNQSTYNHSLIVGGINNKSSYICSTIVNGKQNYGNSYMSLIGNGKNNSAITKSHATVINGKQNLSSGKYSSVINGYYNIAANSYTFIGNGFRNKAYGIEDTIVGGSKNVIGVVGYSTASFINPHNSIINGAGNNLPTSGNRFGFIGSGYRNSGTTNPCVTVINGKLNLASGSYSFIGNGNQNNATGQASFIGAGGSYTVVGNTASGNNSFIGNGRSNTASGNFSSILNGRSNSISSSNYTSIIGGRLNSISTGLGEKSAIVGGYQNSITAGSYNLIGNGSYNSVSSTDNGTILNGFTNTASGTFYPIVLNGSGNTVSGDFSFAGNGVGNLSSGKYSSILNGRNNTASGMFSTSLNGRNNTASGQASSVVAGTGNTISGNLSSILAGTGITSSLNGYAVAQNYAVVTGGTNPSAGIGRTTGGSLTINTNKITNSSLIFLTARDSNFTSYLYVTNIIAGTSFDVQSGDGSDGYFSWWILEPAS